MSFGVILMSSFIVFYFYLVKSKLHVKLVNTNKPMH